MKKYEKIKSLDNEKFRRLIGIRRETFDKMLKILEKEYEFMHRRGGAKPKLAVADKLLITLQYLGSYKTMEHIRSDYDVSESTICESILWVKNILKRDGSIRLPEKKVRQKGDPNNENV